MADEPIQNLYNCLNSLCRQLDFLADPEIEKKMVCSLDCCIGNSLGRYFEDILDDEYKNKHRYAEIIGIEGLELLRKFEKIESQAIGYDDSDSFSMQSKWKEFAFFSKRLSKHIKKTVRDHKKHGRSQRDRYSKDHTSELIERFVKCIVETKKLDGYDLQEYMARSQFVLEHPDKYEGISDALFRQLKRLYFLSFLLLEDYEDGDLFKKVNAFRQKEPNMQRIEELQSCAQTIIDIYDTKQKKI